MDETFNVGNPTKENTYYAFKNLIFYVTASTKLDIYKEQKEKFEKVLVEITNVLETYVNKENLVSLDEEKLQNIKYDLIDLDLVILRLGYIIFNFFIVIYLIMVYNVFKDRYSFR